MPFSSPRLAISVGTRDLVLDAGEHRALGVGLFLVAEIHPRVQADIDAARDDPEGDVRRHQAAVREGHAAGLDRLEAADARFARRSAGGPSRRNSDRPSPRILGWAVVEPVRVGLPDLDQRVPERRAGCRRRRGR